ncbi:hypothetical protein Isop_2374 [Isosphaera pallida ATCC 43644]|uniref:Uncharacterized protein n=1 Tax=Isosphaera pallida (strain ATCC 43644 / DSM 9630 / IS1B) TaxID=575540 RepID=E8QWQ1_ISOPI|nr:hypothetical protein Isop_2374 [Isosphaera pallida ATCC 43644]
MDCLGRFPAPPHSASHSNTPFGLLVPLPSPVSPLSARLDSTRDGFVQA